MYKRSNQGWLKHLDFILLDVIVLQLAFLLSYRIRMGTTLLYAVDTYRNLAIMFAAVDILITAIFNTMHNVLKRRVYSEFVQTTKQVVLVLMVMTLYLFSARIGVVYSRIVVYLTAVFHFVFGFGTRLLWKQIVLHRGRNRAKAPTLLVADEKEIPGILAKLGPADDIEYKGLVLSNRDAEGETISGVPVVANLSNAADYICREWIDEVFVYYSDDESPLENGQKALGLRRSELVEQCRQMSVPVHIRLPLANIGGKSFVEKVGGYNVLTTTSNYASTLQLAIKRVIDILGGLVGSVIALLVMAVAGPMIKKESPGPILFKQTRVGQNGRKFKIYKIRSMYMDAEERKKDLLKDNRVSDGMMFKLDWDPRIIGNKIVDGKQTTGIGEKLRSGSWDEWPQFFNVLLGQMSLVGTRPPTVDEWEKYKYHHRARLSMKPGITGMWQVSGRSKITDFEEVVKLDTEYINHWSVGLDIRILLKTVKTVLQKDGAM